jgi:hypothetical protein
MLPQQLFSLQMAEAAVSSGKRGQKRKHSDIENPSSESVDLFGRYPSDPPAPEPGDLSTPEDASVGQQQSGRQSVFKEDDGREDTNSVGASMDHTDHTTDSAGGLGHSGLGQGRLGSGWGQAHGDEDWATDSRLAGSAAETTAFGVCATLPLGSAAPSAPVLLRFPFPLQMPMPDPVPTPPMAVCDLRDWNPTVTVFRLFERIFVLLSDANDPWME